VVLGRGRSILSVFALGNVSVGGEEGLPLVIFEGVGGCGIGVRFGPYVIERGKDQLVEER